MAGKVFHVSAALASLHASAQVNAPSTCLPVLTLCSTYALCNLRPFPEGIDVHRSGAVDLLGAAIGDTAYCCEETASCFCASGLPFAAFSTHLYVVRVAPRAAALDAFDSVARECLARAACLPTPGCKHPSP